MSIEILLLEMIKRISIAIVLGLVLAQTKLFDRLITHSLSLKDRLIFIFLFSGIAIAGTYAGIPIDDALANSRMVGIMAAGLIGGPFIGTSVGVIAGIHRFFFGGFTALACTISSITEGILAGLVHKYYPRTPVPWPIALLVGAIGEALQMTIILLLAKPYELAYALVNEIAIPMTVANSLGLVLFVRIIADAMEHREIIMANQSYFILSIAKQTVGHLRKGLTSETATEVVKIIKENSQYDAVSITDRTRVIAYVGAEANHHGPGKSDHLTEITLRALQSGKTRLAQAYDEIGCHVPGCTLHSAVVVPLTTSNEVIGTLKLYYTLYNHQIGPADIAFAQGLADLFSTQLELTEIDRQAKLTEEARLQSLYTQINPHFLFNTLNTISSLIRTNPETARKLLIKFSHLFRFTLQYTGQIIPFSKEWEQANAFLSIAQARQGDKLTVEIDMAPEVLPLGIPSLTLQPIIENAIKHGLQPLEEGGTLLIHAYLNGDTDWTIDVSDNGQGFTNDPEYILNNPPQNHIGLSNVHQRLQSLYGPNYGLTIVSEPNEGTCVSIHLPQETSHD